MELFELIYDNILKTLALSIVLFRSIEAMAVTNLSLFRVTDTAMKAYSRNIKKQPTHVVNGCMIEVSLKKVW